MAKTNNKKVVVSAPLYIDLPRKTKKDKRCHVNLNQYRNWHYLVSNQVKQLYKEAVSDQLRELRFEEPIELTLTLYKSSKRKLDRANVLSIQEKFFCDALVELGCIEDDNDNFIKATHYYTGGIDRENPRVEIEIRSV